MHNFQLIRYWSQLTEECDEHMNMFQCSCPLCFKFEFCPYAWVIQILVDRGHAYIIPHEKKGEAEAQDIPKQPRSKQKNTKVQKAKAIPDPPKIPRVWKPISMNPKDLPVCIMVDDDYMAAEDAWNDEQL